MCGHESHANVVECGVRVVSRLRAERQISTAILDSHSTIESRDSPLSPRLRTPRVRFSAMHRNVY